MREPKVKVRESYTSNLINNEELARRFTSEAYAAAASLKTKYYSLFQFMNEDDIVMECWDKILRQDISYDDSKRCKFSSFVRMMVNNRCIDLSRKIQKHEGVVSLDQPHTSSDGDSVTLLDFIADQECQDRYDDIEIRDIILSLDADIPAVPVKKIMDMLSDGYTAKEVSEELKVSAVDIRTVRTKFKNIFKHRSSGSEQTLGDVLYGDEESLEARREELSGVLWYIKEDGMRLSDIVDMIIDGYSYKGISEKLKKTESSVKWFLDRNLGLII
jgi:DNA-directed RNA polymerase specialized sigma24 family protein